MDAFKDMLESKRDGYNLSYIVNTYAPQKMHVHKETFNPESFRRHVLQCFANSEIMKQLSGELAMSEKDLLKRIETIYEEISRGRNVPAMRFFAFCFLQVLKNTIAQLFVTEEKILKLKCKASDKSIVLLPTHRSYADCSLITWILYDYNIEVPSVVSGIGLGQMCVISYFLRSSGAMFMRRTFQNDKIYSVTFKTYVQTLLKKVDAPFDFFIEGTRSRSGKSLMPKFGCLKIIADVFNNDRNSDIILLPISAHYDKVLEDELYAYEVLGQSKPKESTLQLMKGLINIATRNNGNAYVNFCEPISLSEYFSRHKELDLDVLAHTVIASQKKNTIFTAFNLLCAVLVCHMSTNNNHRFSLHQVVDGMVQLKRLLAAFGAIVNFEDRSEKDILKEIKRVVLIHEKLVTLDERLGTIHLNLTEDKSSQSSGLNIKNYRPNLISLIMLQYYANSCVQFIINALAIASLSSTSKLISNDKLFRSYTFFRRIFKHEFVLHSRFETEEFQETIRILNDLNKIRDIESSSVIYLNCEDNFRIFSRGLIEPFTSGFCFICDFFLLNTSGDFDRKSLINAIRKFVNSQVQRYEYKYSYALSSDFISNCLESLSEMNIINFDKKSGMDAYECHHADDITEVKIFLRTLNTDG